MPQQTMLLDYTAARRLLDQFYNMNTREQILWARRDGNAKLLQFAKDVVYPAVAVMNGTPPTDPITRAIRALAAWWRKNFR